MSKKFVTPSLLNVDVNKRVEMANTLINNGISWIHYDVMDGKFVPNLAISKQEIINISKNTKEHFKDVHLMVENPTEYVEELKDYVDVFTFHYESIDEESLLDWLESKNTHYCKIGLAIKPNTNVEVVNKFAKYLSLVLVMSVEPGKGGQKFIESAYGKIQYLKKLRIDNGYDFLIQVDGGINNITGPECFKYGADACVAGTFLVKNPTSEQIKSILGRRFSK
ncbi:ribulose-phosphate 3-epimerase [Mycoplasmopsis anatis]|uniref:Ribulose-phosphate 3-epimerase n=2 Tax=Mycoplasmopsis anatis TaxID=171279 RepID=F9QCR0_9BACT|nr:ribulose-phosphate 3-epimerase [Mycoplasmopsis anatis]AWX70014.1 ribulose-phosphate 3-epimerase [Mycoplasmopsis anatis]EGS29477.1 ribulose-phosphate 3-epimerase [Mycoplasmopsis anatis 1340]MBW0594497.1 ribulose-phosphate 3-epimerase [Mycoplasmopsis anatis]MBW0595234.1 ribulose-phosphate 3-epimerase [Mycoplasmopsis anatis]MBW0596154.1 ribulose-phosphate 3-epimerase [Mycoplasmopsis anatis]